MVEVMIENPEHIEDAVQPSPSQTFTPRAKKKASPKKSVKKKARRPTQEPTVHSVILHGCRNCRKLRGYMRKDQRKKVGCSSEAFDCLQLAVACVCSATGAGETHVAPGARKAKPKKGRVSSFKRGFTVAAKVGGKSCTLEPVLPDSAIEARMEKKRRSSEAGCIYTSCQRSRLIDCSLSNLLA